MALEGGGRVTLGKEQGVISERRPGGRTCPGADKLVSWTSAQVSSVGILSEVD